MAETCWKLALGSVKEKSLSIVLPGLTSGTGLALQIAFHIPALQRFQRTHCRNSSCEAATVKQQLIALKDVITRDLCMLPAVAVAPPRLHVANPPYTYTHGMKLFKISLKEQVLPYFHSMQQIAGPHFLQFPDPRLVQHGSGKLGALAILLWKLKAEGQQVLILTQMILELFLNFRDLT